MRAKDAPVKEGERGPSPKEDRKLFPWVLEWGCCDAYVLVPKEKMSMETTNPIAYGRCTWSSTGLHHFQKSHR